MPITGCCSNSKDYGCLKTDYELKQIDNLIVPKLTNVLTETEITLNTSADEPQSMAQNEPSNSMDVSTAEVYSAQEPIATDASAQQNQQPIWTQKKSSIVTEPELPIVASTACRDRCREYCASVIYHQRCSRNPATQSICRLYSCAAWRRSLVTTAISFRNSQPAGTCPISQIYWCMLQIWKTGSITQFTWQSRSISTVVLFDMWHYWVTENQTQAMRLMQLLNAPYQHAMAAIRQMPLDRPGRSFELS